MKQQSQLFLLGFLMVAAVANKGYAFESRKPATASMVYKCQSKKMGGVQFAETFLTIEDTRISFRNQEAALNFQAQVPSYVSTAEKRVRADAQADGSWSKPASLASLRVSDANTGLPYRVIRDELFISESGLKGQKNTAIYYILSTDAKVGYEVREKNKINCSRVQ